MKSAYLIITTFFVMIACKEGYESKAQRENEPDVYNLNSDDSQMKEAKDLAQKTFNVFQESLKNDSTSELIYSIKQEYKTLEGTEHIWVSVFSFKNNEMLGTIDNEPLNDIGVELGDTIKIKTNRISDWLILDEKAGVMQGGYTIKVLRDKMTDEEREQFDQEFGYAFD